MHVDPFIALCIGFAAGLFASGALIRQTRDQNKEIKHRYNAILEAIRVAKAKAKVNL